MSTGTLIDRWVSTARLPKRKCGENTTDLLQCVQRRFQTFSSGKPWKGDTFKSALHFLVDWISLSYSVTSTSSCDSYPRYLCHIAEGQNIGLKVQTDDWIEWRLPKFAAHLMAIKFTQGLKKSDHLEVFCAADCSGWEHVFSSQDHDAVETDTVVTCRCEFMVQRFKLHMVSGEFNPHFLKFECILREV